MNTAKEKCFDVRSLFAVSKISMAYVDVPGCGYYGLGDRWPENYAVTGKTEGNGQVIKSTALYGLRAYLAGASVDEKNDVYDIRTERYHFRYVPEKSAFFSDCDTNSPEARGTMLGMAAFVQMNEKDSRTFTEMFGESPDKAACWFCDYVQKAFSDERKFSFTVEKSSGNSIAEIKERTAEVLDFSMESVKSGRYILNFEWDRESEEHIPSLDVLDSFIPTRAYWELVRKFRYRLEKISTRIAGGEGSPAKAMQKDYLNIELVGDPASGKNILLQAVAATLGLPFYTENIHPGTEEDTFEGKNKIVDGKLNFVKTDFLDAFTKGGIIVLDEVNFAEPAITAMLNDSLVAPFVLKEDGYIKRVRNPLCCICTTHNTDTAGTRTINEAFDRRLMYTKYITAPSDDEFVSFLTLYHPEPECRWVYECFRKVKSFLEGADAQDISRAVAIDSCFAVLNDIEEGRDRIESLENFWGKVMGRDIKLGEDLRQVCESFPSEIYGKADDCIAV